jgi:SAM-dependent methyltransferase
VTPEKTVDATPYSALAAGYDVVMEHVDYEGWAVYVHHLLQRFHPAPAKILELGCGTATFALTLVQLGHYRYLATDSSEAMIRVARAKADLESAPVDFGVADFTNFSVDPPVDVVILLYDGLNYLLEDEAVRSLLACAYRALTPGGLFFFDQSTPANSINNEDYFGDEGEAEGFAYVRKSRYDREARIHTTTFEITIEGRSFHEVHLQRAYAQDEIRALVDETEFEVVAAYDGFTADPATPEAERIHWLLRRPA